MDTREQPLKGVFIENPDHLSVGIGEMQGHDLDGKKVFGLIVENPHFYIEMLFSKPCVEMLKRGIAKYDEELKQDEF